MIRAKFQDYLSEEAKRLEMSEDRVIELALGYWQQVQVRLRDGFHPVWTNDAGETHWLDKPGGCMGDD